MYHFWKTSLRDSLDDPNGLGKENLKIQRVLMLLVEEIRLYTSERIPPLQCYSSIHHDTSEHYGTRVEV